MAICGGVQRGSWGRRCRGSSSQHVRELRCISACCGSITSLLQPFSFFHLCLLCPYCFCFSPCSCGPLLLRLPSWQLHLLLYFFSLLLVHAPFLMAFCLQRDMVRLRLQRFGVRNNPFYRIVAADSRWPRDGKALEYLGMTACSTPFQPIFFSSEKGVLSPIFAWDTCIRSILSSCMQARQFR